MNKGKKIKNKKLRTETFT